MGLTATEVDTWATELAGARHERRTREPITDTVPLTLADAYAIQDALTARRLAAGERIVGWKLGYTSPAMRAQMGIDQPNFGPLTDAMILTTGATVGTALIHPRVEPEIGLRFGRPLHGDVTVDDVLDAVVEAFACLEVVDSVFRDYRFRLEDNTADGSSAARVVVGPELVDRSHLDAVTVVMRHNGAEVGAATGAAASGHPAAGVVWLVSQLAREGRRLEAGDIVITGGLTRAVPLQPGDVVDAVFDGHTQVSVRGPLTGEVQPR